MRCLTLNEGPTSLALAGGGSKGAYHIGVLSRLIQDFNFLDFPCVYGTSVGALIAGPLGLVSSEKDISHFSDLWEIYSEIETEGVYSPNNEFVYKTVGEKGALVWSILSGEQSIFDITPLIKQIDRLMTTRRWEQLIDAARRNSNRVEVGFCVANLTRRRSEMVTTSTFPDPEVLRRAMIASASQPVFMPAVDIFENGELYVDGGLYDVVPASWMMQSEFVRRSSQALAVSLDRFGSSPAFLKNNIPDVLLRVLDMFVDSVWDRNREFLYCANFINLAKEELSQSEWNRLVGKLPDLEQDLIGRLTTRWRDVPLYLYEPTEEIEMDALEFVQPDMKNLIRSAYREASRRIFLRSSNV